VLKKNITYKDFNGNEVTDLFTFHLSPADLLEIEAETPGGMQAMMNTIAETNDTAVIMNVFKVLINRSVGKVSDNGKQFLRSEEILNEFRQSNAYSALLLEMIRDEEFAATFFNTIMPEGLDQIEVAVKGPDAPILRTTQPEDERAPDGSYGGARGVEEKIITQQEAREMSRDQLLNRVQSGWIIKG